MKLVLEPTKNNRTIKIFESDVKEANDQERTIVHLITRRVVDRDGDVIEPKGVRIENYKRNPVVLFGHGYAWETTPFPIGKNLSLDIRDNEIEAMTKFAGLDQHYDSAETAYRLARDGFLRAWSVGFDPITWSEDKALPDQDGWWFKEWELYEYSLCDIPSNPEALSRFAKAYRLPDGATEKDLADAIKANRQLYWDVAKSLALHPERVGDRIIPARFKLVEVEDSDDDIERTLRRLAEVDKARRLGILSPVAAKLENERAIEPTAIKQAVFEALGYPDGGRC